MGHVAHMGETGDICRILVRKPQGKRLLGRCRHRWEDNTEMNPNKTRCDDVDWIHMAQNRDQLWTLEKVVMNFHVP
jgi:hypothetical protein